MRSPHLNEPWYNNFYTTKYTPHVYDKMTFALTMPENKPDLAQPPRATSARIRATPTKDFGPGWLERFQWRTLPTTGAYVLKEKDIDKGRSVTLTRQENWWAATNDSSAAASTPTATASRSFATRQGAEAFARGDLDMFPLGLPKFWYETISATTPRSPAGYIVQRPSSSTASRAPTGASGSTAPNPASTQLDVRLGIQHATNFDLVCAVLPRRRRAHATRSDGYPFRTHPTITARPFDPVKAREHFRQGRLHHPGSGRRAANAAGRRLSFTLTTFRPDLRDLLPILETGGAQGGTRIQTGGPRPDHRLEKGSGEEPRNRPYRALPLRRILPALLGDVPRLQRIRGRLPRCRPASTVETLPTGKPNPNPAEDRSRPTT
jgi:microcin C transport system substrate-binding protein